MSILIKGMDMPKGVNIDMEKLKACPFCGRQPTYWIWNNGAMVECHQVSHRVQCEAKTMSKAVEAWNRRVNDDSRSSVTAHSVSDNSGMSDINVNVKRDTDVVRESATTASETTKRRKSNVSTD